MDWKSEQDRADALFEELSRLLKLKASMVGVNKDTLPAALQAGLFRAVAHRLAYLARARPIDLKHGDVAKWLQLFNVAEVRFEGSEDAIAAASET